jgi:hypothetical protein
VTTDDTDDDGPVTPEDIAAAKARWADPKHQPDITELFARPVLGNGLRGDVLIGEADEEPDGTDSPKAPRE